MRDCGRSTTVMFETKVAPQLDLRAGRLPQTQLGQSMEMIEAAGQGIDQLQFPFT